MKKPFKILHLDTNHPLLWQQLADAGFENTLNTTDGKEEIEKIIPHYHGIIIRSRFAIDAAFMDKATQLHFIARVGAGLENIDVAHAKSKNIQLIAAPEGNANAVGEHALGMLLSLFNNLNKAHTEVTNGKWLREANRGIELSGKTVGILGYGNMGQSLAKKLQGFDVRVICFDLLQNVGNAYAQQVDYATFLAETDILSMHTPLTETTRNWLNQDRIAAFQKNFWLINTARGKSVNTTDLVQALQSGKIKGAALDVLEYEKTSFESLFDDHNTPPALQYLTHAHNVLLSPHIAGWTHESHEKLAQVIVEKIKIYYKIK